MSIYSQCVLAANEVDIRNVWNSTQSEFSKAAIPGIGFSFRYDGNTVGPNIQEEELR